MPQPKRGPSPRPTTAPSSTRGDASADSPKMAFTGVTFTGETIRLDGRRFVNCTFTDCVIEIGGWEAFALEHPTFTKCQWTAVGPALLTLRILSQFYQEPDMRGFVEATFANIRRGRGPDAPATPKVDA